MIRTRRWGTVLVTLLLVAAACSSSGDSDDAGGGAGDGAAPAGDRLAPQIGTLPDEALEIM